MKKMTGRIAAILLFLWILPVQAQAARMLVPVGQVVGLELQDGTVTVADFDPEQADALQAAGLQVGDRIEKVNGTTVRCAEDIRKALQNCGSTVSVQIRRSGKEKQLTLTPKGAAGSAKLGIYLRQGITGVGTVTWYDPNTGAYGALGHGVNDGSGALVSVERGSIFGARVVTVRKGVSGEPGQLMGALRSREVIGTVEKNTSRGVFGTAERGWQGQTLPVASSAQIRTGDAVILSAVDEKGVREYSVEILKIYPRSKENGRNLLLKVTDPALLQATGGIVQGMSGSPIIQDGRLVGAVTHVLVNDPTTGYGIFIENMLDAAA